MCAMPNPVKVRLGEGCGGLVGCFQEPGFELRRSFKWLALLVAHTAKNVISQLTGVRSDADSDLFAQEVFNVFGQSNGHK